MFTCKLTGTTGRPVKAHIVPRAFYEVPEQSDGPLRLATNSEGTYPKKIPIGVYDQEIVTRDGEAYFGPWDDYAASVLLHSPHQLVPIKANEQVLAWQVAGTDYEKLKLFALSVLWRAHASEHKVFSRVDLGPHEPCIRQMLLDSDPGAEEDYSVCVVRWIDEDFGPVFMDPLSERYESVYYYRIYCGRYVLYVKVDQRRTGPKFRDIQLAPGRPLYLVARQLKKSKEWPLMVKIARANER